MDSTLLPSKTEVDTERVYRHIFRNAMGVPIEFASAPSASELQPNTWGFYGTDIYMKLSDGSTIKLSGASF